MRLWSSDSHYVIVRLYKAAAAGFLCFALFLFFWFTSIIHILFSKGHVSYLIPSVLGIYGVNVQLEKAAVRRCSSKWVFLKISQISQENTCVEVSF